jgi:hypothetical protein
MLRGKRLCARREAVINAVDKLFIRHRDEAQPLLSRAGYLRGSAHLYLGQRALRKMGHRSGEMIAIGGQGSAPGRTCSIWRANCGAIGLPQIWYRAGNVLVRFDGRGQDESYRSTGGSLRRIWIAVG